MQVEITLTLITVPDAAGIHSPFWNFQAINVVFNQKSSFIRGQIPLKVIFHKRLSSIKGRLPSKVVFHQKSSSIEGRLTLKVGCVGSGRVHPSKCNSSPHSTIGLVVFALKCRHFCTRAHA